MLRNYRDRVDAFIDSYNSFILVSILIPLATLIPLEISLKMYTQVTRSRQYLNIVRYVDFKSYEILIECRCRCIGPTVRVLRRLSTATDHLCEYSRNLGENDAFMRHNIVGKVHYQLTLYRVNESRCSVKSRLTFIIRFTWLFVPYTNFLLNIRPR